MKKYLVLLVLGLFFGSLAYGYRSPLPKKEGGYVLLDSATGNQTPRSKTTKSWTDVNTDANWVFIPAQWRGPGGYVVLSFEFQATSGSHDPNSGACDVNVLFARPYGGVKKAGEYRVGAGDVALSYDPNSGIPYRSNGAVDANHVFGDTISRIVADDWPGTIEISGESGSELYGNVATVTITMPEPYIRVEFVDVNTTDVNLVRCLMTGGSL